MIEAAIQIGAGIGFILVWAAFAGFFVTVAMRFFPVFWRRYASHFWMSSEEGEALRQALSASSTKTRRGYVVQLLFACGVTLLILSGIAWLVVRIVERHG